MLHVGFFPFPKDIVIKPMFFPFRLPKSTGQARISLPHNHTHQPLYNIDYMSVFFQNSY
jgi:hypothetical protein